jgi:tetratricopeptide (TPR) repeat protein
LGVFHAAVGHGTTRPTDRPDVPGVRVARVAPGSAAERAGIRPSDLIVRLNQKPIGSAEDLHSALASLRPQSHVVVDIVRGDRSLSLEAFLGERTEALPTQENTADEAASAGDRGNARSAERQSRAERCRRLARSLYERLIEIEPYDWAHVNALSDFLLASSAPWFETKSGAISLPFEAKSEAGVILTRLADGSFLASGKNPKSDTYTLRFRAATRGFQILRFDVLPDPSLPHAGSGRSPLGNFVLSQIQVEAEGKILPLQAVSASFSQVGFPFDVVVNPQVVASSGWAIAPRMGQPQSAYFVLDSRSISSDEVPLTLRLSFKSQFEYHTMGRFRLALSRPIPSRPAEQLLAAHTLAALETRGWTRLAMIHALRGEWLEAAGACQKEIDRDPEKGSRLLAFASLLLYESGRKSEARRKLDEAISWLKSNESAPAERALAALALSRVAARNDVEIQSVLAEIAGQGRRRELTRAIEAEPKNVALYSARAEFHARRGEWQQAAVDLRKSYELDAQVNPRADIQLARLGNMLLLAGDRDAYERLCQEKLRQQGRFPSEAAAANGVVWLFCLAPGATADYRDLVSLMEKTVQAASQAERVAYLSNTLGAILYRAGRYREALERLTEGQAATKVDPAPQDLAFLALVHERLGNAAEARRWRDRLRAYPTPGDAPSNAFWNNLEIPVLLKEVESVVAGP